MNAFGEFPERGKAFGKCFVRQKFPESERVSLRFQELLERFLAGGFLTERTSEVLVAGLECRDLALGHSHRLSCSRHEPEEASQLALPDCRVRSLG